MECIVDLLARLPDKHRSALEWFVKNEGATQGWPKALPDGILLASKAKGIYKPSWTIYALSVRQSLGGPYPDKEPIIRPDGTWIYSYFQEGDDPENRDAAYTNRGLMACWQDNVPVGVIRQVRDKPYPLYHVLGVALVAGWDGGYFFLEGFTKDGRSHKRGPRAEIESLMRTHEDADDSKRKFNPDSVIDGRERIVATIIRRRGQPEFRRKLLDLYEGRCAISSWKRRKGHRKF